MCPLTWVSTNQPLGLCSLGKFLKKLQHHSTQIALLKLKNNIMEALDNGCQAILITLDLSAAFDTTDHHVLLDPFKQFILGYRVLT